MTPAIPMRWEIVRSTADTGGELLETLDWVGPRLSGPPVHVHPTAEESCEVVEGELEVYVGREWRTLRAGEKVVVPPGTAHTLRNASDERVRLVNVHRPALRFEAMFRELHRLIVTGRVRALPPRDLRSMIAVASLFEKYSDEQRVTRPPIAVFKALSLLGRISSGQPRRTPRR